MSSPILPIWGPSGPPGHSASAPTADGGASDGGAFLAALAASERMPTIEASRGGPPPEVLDQIAAAAGRNEQLRASGRELRFCADEQSGRVTIELRDRQAGTARTISAAEALDIAAGKALG
jgi:hypothetical protein